MRRFTPINLKAANLNLKPYLKNIVAGTCGLLMLVAYFAFTPWMQFNFAAFAGQMGGDTAGAGGDAGGFQMPEGFTPPDGFELPEGFEIPEGFTPPQGGTGGFQLPEGFTPPQGGQGGGGFAGGFPGGGAPESPGRFLVAIAGVVALIGAVGSGLRPRYNRLATALTVLAGLLALVYYGIFFVQDALIPISFVDMTTFGFWLALMASIGLVVQALIPRPAQAQRDDANVTLLVEQRKRSGLSLRQNIAVSMDALMANKLRSGLTMLGIVIGVTSVVALVSVGRGAQAAVTEQIAGTGLNLLTVSPGGGGGFGPGGGGGGGSGGRLYYDDADAIASRVTGITAVLPQYSGNLQVRSDSASYNASVLGTTQDYAEVRSIGVEIGRYFTLSEYRDSARVVVLGSRAAEELFGGLNPLDRDIRIDGTRFRVIGVLGQQDSGFGSDPNLQIYVPLTTAYRNLFNARAVGSTRNTVSSIIVAVADIEQVDQVSDQIEAALRQAHRLKDDENNDFSILNQQQLLDAASAVTGILTVLLGAIASISLLVGGIGIMNIMLVSVTERTKEIGLRKAVGARRGHILQQFLIETIVLSTLGGVIGVGLGVLIATLVNASGLLNASVSLDSIALGLGFSVIVGIFFGVYPANQAAALEPIEALRYE